MWLTSSDCYQNILFILAISKPALKLYGVQFHPEVDLTIQGKIMLGNFLYKIGGLAPSFKIENRLDSCIKQLKNIVGERKVLVSLFHSFLNPNLFSICYSLGLADLRTVYALNHRIISSSFNTLGLCT